ncbi:hypothetical protein LTS18_004990 [Coniosporium uncinatum]|uniref:Uncharacterized protein n=1 Tax=Coniosporium uncinatum TaxID=93489 RepID=A0ACC3DYI3_9PEZI|nr:hypothetical protein LTS18_004990 [Coniosporium uncinatum]
MRDAENLPDFAVRCVKIKRKNPNEDFRVKANFRGPLSVVAIVGFVQSLVILALSIYYADGMALLAVVVLSLLSTLIGFANYWTLELPKRKVVEGKGFDDSAPPGDVVIRYPKGAFLVVECSEDVARQLYFAPETINYFVKKPLKYRMMSLVGTLMLMAGVVCLGNATNILQITFGAAYMMLNAAYWVVAALDPKEHWDLSGFDIEDQVFTYEFPLPSHSGDKIVRSKHWPFKKMLEPGEKDEASELQTLQAKNAKQAEKVMTSLYKQSKHRSKAEEYKADFNETFTQALWKVIIATGSVKWAIKGDAVPATPAWSEWLREAKKQARSVNNYKEPVYREMDGKSVRVFKVPDWNPQDQLNTRLKDHKDDIEDLEDD